jgi:hypothetical protein
MKKPTLLDKCGFFCLWARSGNFPGVRDLDPETTGNRQVQPGRSKYAQDEPNEYPSQEIIETKAHYEGDHPFSPFYVSPPGM